jgi:hypothetical protein
VRDVDVSGASRRVATRGVATPRVGRIVLACSANASARADAIAADAIGGGAGEIVKPIDVTGPETDKARCAGCRKKYY